MKQQPTCVCINLRRAARAVSQIYDHALANAGIKVTQFSLLRAIERLQPVAISVLADEVELDRTTLARNLAPLQRDRLVALASGEDQRVTEVRLTSAGRTAIAKALPLWQRAQQEFVWELTEKRITELREIAGEISASVARLSELNSPPTPPASPGRRRSTARR